MYIFHTLIIKFCFCSQLVPGLNVNRYTWTVSSPGAVAAITKLLDYQQPSRLFVDIRDGVPSSRKLRKLLGSVKNHGELGLRLWQSYLNFDSCDYILTELNGARLEDNYTTYRLSCVQCKAVLTIYSFFNGISS